MLVKPPIGLSIIESCATCKLREERLFCNLKGVALQQLERIKFSTSYSANSTLFSEGQPSSGVMILCQGRVKLSMSGTGGKTAILKIVEPGEVLGLSSTVSGILHDTTAEALDPVQVNIIRKDDFLKFLADYPDACMHAVQELSNTHNTACHEIRTLTLSQSVAERFAKLLLEWDAKTPESSKGRITVGFTHEEVAQLLGTAREVVSRLIGDFKNKRVIQVKGATWVVTNRSALQKIAGIQPTH